MTQEHPGLIIAEYLDGEDAADLLGISDRYCGLLLTGDAPVTSHIAQAMENLGYGTCHWWMNQQVRFNRNNA